MGELSLEFQGVAGMAELHHTNGDITPTEAKMSPDVSGVDFTKDAAPELAQNLLNTPGLGN